MCSLLHAGGIRCRAVEREEYLALMIEKLLWASVYWLLSAGLGGLPVGTIAQEHGGAAAELASELLPLAQQYVVGAAGRLQAGSTQQVRPLPVATAHSAGEDAPLVV